MRLNRHELRALRDMVLSLYDGPPDPTPRFSDMLYYQVGSNFSDFAPEGLQFRDRLGLTMIELNKQGKIRTLLDVLDKEFPERADLRKMIVEFRGKFVDNIEDLESSSAFRNVFNPKYWITFMVIFIIFLSYPFILFSVALDFENAVRWWKHEPAYNLFALFILPLAGGLIARSFFFVQKEPWTRVDDVRGRKIALMVLVPFAALMAVPLAVADGMRKAVVQPFYFSNTNECVFYERQIRSDILELTRASGSDARLIAARSVQAHCHGFVFRTWKSFELYASDMAYLSIVLDAFGYFIAFTFFAQVFASCVLYQPSQIEELTIPISFCLLISWFPFRIYSDWYLHFFGLVAPNPYSSFAIFTLLAILLFGIISVRYEVYIRRVTFFIVVSTILFVSAFFVFFSESVWWIWRTIDPMNFAQAILLKIILVAGIGAIIGSFLFRAQKAFLESPLVNRRTL